MNFKKKCLRSTYEWPLSIDLARNYLIKPTTATGQDLDNLEKVCRHNANVARSFGILDLSKSWKMVSRLSNLLCENDMKALQDYNKKVIIDEINFFARDIF